MKTTCLLFLTMIWATLAHGTGYAVPELVPCPLPWGEGIGQAAPELVGRPLPWGEGVPRPAFSPAGAGRVRGPWGPASQQTSRESSANTASDHPGDPAQRDAAPPRDERHQTEGKASHEQRDHSRASDTNHPPSRASLTKVNRPKQLPNSRQRSLPGNAMNLHPPGSDKSAGAAKGGLIQNETVNNVLPVRTPSVVRPTVPALNNVRHRGPNPAVVGGSPISHSSNTGAINGTRMNRKP